MQVKQVPTIEPIDKRFLLIKQWGFGFWSDMEDVQSKLLLAEITNRQPIIFWGPDSLYSVAENTNSFEQYFFPISNDSISDVVNDNFTYYPPIWNATNLSQTDPDRLARANRDIPSFIKCDANVLISDVHNFMYEIMPLIGKEHPAYGLTENDVYRYINEKYLRLRPDIVAEIEAFYRAHLQTGPILAVHIRAGAKLNEHPYWKEVIGLYPHEINRYLHANPSARIFLLTDDTAVLKQFKQMYGDILICTDCMRKTNEDIELCLKVFSDQRRKGIEIIKDTYLACKCDSFIGNGNSNVALAISRLKIWHPDKIKIVMIM